MPFDFGDVILAPFPFTNQSAVKQRPAVIVSTRRYNDMRRNIVITAVTSQLRPQPGSFGVAILGWRAAGLLKPSVVKPLFATLEKALVIRMLGSLDVADQTNLRNAIALILS